LKVISPNQNARLHAMKKVISLTNHTAEKHVQNSVYMLCSQIPKIKINKNDSFKKFDIYVEPFSILVYYIKTSQLAGKRKGSIAAKRIKDLFV
jgi:hypothetical protein